MENEFNRLRTDAIKKLMQGTTDRSALHVLKRLFTM